MNAEYVPADLTPGPDPPREEEAPLLLAAPEDQPEPASVLPEGPPRLRMGAFQLVDCFLEIFTYTGYLLENLETQDVPFEEVARHTLALIHRAEGFRARVEVTDEAWGQALFAVCAWVDECLLCSSWRRKDQWFPVQLQRLHFNTTRAGELFFTRLRELPPEEVQVREVYDYCLALGFKGRHYDPSEAPALEGVRRENLERLIGSEELRIPGELFPEVDRTPGAAASQPAVRVHHLLVALWVVLPVAVFAGLYAFFDRILDGTVNSIVK